MSIQSQINRISQNVTDSLSAVAAKGVTVPSGSNSDDLPELIALIPTGSGSAVSVVDTTDPTTGETTRTITAVSLEGDTVNASSLLKGYTAHNSLGQAITGTYEALPCPVFTVLNDAEGHEISITCNKTFNECISLLSDDSYTCLSAIAVERGQTVDGAPEVWDHAYCGATYNGSVNPRYIRYYSTNAKGVPVYQLTYYSNGTITNSYENIDPLVELTVTQNGTYSALPDHVYSTVTVNVPTTSTDADYPIFTVTYTDGRITSITCDKTYAQCRNYIQNDYNHIGVAIIHIDNVEITSSAEGFIGNNVCRYVVAGDGGLPDFDINYASTGTITWADSASLTSFTANQNGTWSSAPGVAYDSVTVNVPAATLPVFTITWDSTGLNVSSITCNKTFSECVTMIQDSTNMVVGAVGYEGMTGTDMIHWFGLTGYIVTNQSGTPTRIAYYGTDAYGVPAVQINYNSNGTITRSGVPDSLDTLNVSSNGTYNAPGGSVYNRVVVSVPATTPNLQAKTNISPSTSSQTIQADSGYDGLSSVQINAMPEGSASLMPNVMGTSATVSTGTNTLTLSKQITITPYVEPGYISSGEATECSVSLTASVTTKGAATITPTKSTQTIASGTYLTGTQTIAAIPAAYQDVTGVTASAADVVSGKDIVNSSGTVVHGSLVIQHYYTGSGAPSSSTGVNGDIYLQTS